MSDSTTSAPTYDDWKEMLALAWQDPSFRQQLETDPTTAIKAWAKDNGREYERLLTLVERADQLRAHDDGDVAMPTCC